MGLQTGKRKRRGLRAVADASGAGTSPTEINDCKHAFVERLGAECAALDVPFSSELVSYPEGMEDKEHLSAAHSSFSVPTEGVQAGHTQAKDKGRP